MLECINNAEKHKARRVKGQKPRNRNECAGLCKTREILADFRDWLGAKFRRGTALESAHAQPVRS